jgi:PhzF family phenazine biosynthesis protein
MKLKIYQVDAFADQVFAGNPAAVCPLENWIDDDLMQKIAMENNLAETAFYVRRKNEFEIRWFTPSLEVDLCGHATLASAHVLFEHENFEGEEIRFHSSRSGALRVYREKDLLTLDFPADNFAPIEITPKLIAAFSFKPLEAYKGKTDYMLLFNDETQIKNLQPDFARIAGLTDCRGVIVTAKGDEVDFVSRFFAPQSGVNEDPVTGSAHTTLTPYWTKKLSKKELSAVQLSARKGFLHCKCVGDRVHISGKAKTYLTGEIMF